MPRSFRVPSAVAIILAGVLVATTRAGVISNTDAELQYQLATLLFDETRYWEALTAFERAADAPDAGLALRALKGKVRTQLRLAEFVPARADAERLKAVSPRDPEVLSLYADSLWASGLFDEAEAVYRDVLTLTPESARGRFGLARSEATHNRLDRALTEALAASAAAPRDGEIHALIGEIYERKHQFGEAAVAFGN